MTGGRLQRPKIDTPMKIERLALSDEWKRDVAANLAHARRQRAHFPFRNRWLIVKVRFDRRAYVHRLGWRGAWREVWQDLIYLVRG